MRKTLRPTSIPVSRPVSGSGWVGTSAQEKHTYQPSASRLSVTVFMVPSMRRDQRAVVQPGAIAIRFVGEGVVALAPLEAGKARLLASGEPAQECLIGLV